MTVPATYVPASYYANGVTTVFPYAFKILKAEHLVVAVNGTTKVLNVDYTLSGVGLDAGGNVTFISGAPSNNALVEIIRNVPLKRDTDFQKNGDLQSTTLNADLDAVVMMIQDAISAGHAFNDPIPSGDLAPPADSPTTGLPTNDVLPNDTTNRLNTQTVVNYTPNIHDAWGLVEMDYPTANNFNIPLNSAVPYLVGTAIHIVQRGAGQTTVVHPGGAAKLKGAAVFKTRARYSIIIIYYRGNDEWYVGGDLTLTGFVADPSPPATQVLTVPTGYYWYTRYLQFNTDGTITKVDVANVSTAAGRWHSGTPVPSDYLIYCQQTAGDMENNASDAKYVFMALTSPRRWEVENSTGTKFLTIRVSIKQISTGLVVSNSYTLDRRTGV